MKVTLNGVEYKIHFQYQDGKRGKVTACYITVDDLVVAEGATTCSKGDKFTKEDGRQVSLTRAIRKALADGVPKVKTGFWDALWNAYVNRPRGKA